MLSTLFTCFICVASLVRAAPTDSTVPPCVNGVRTYKPAFDKMKPNTVVPDNFDQVLWNGFTTVDALATYNIKPSSGKIAIQGPSIEGSKLGLGIGELKGFSFACVGSMPGSGNTFPFPCDILLITTKFFLGYDVQTYGPYSYSVNYTMLEQGIPANMTKVELSAQASEVYFQVVSGVSNSVVLLDNLVFEVLCSD